MTNKQRIEDIVINTVNKIALDPRVSIDKIPAVRSLYNEFVFSYNKRNKMIKDKVGFQKYYAVLIDEDFTIYMRDVYSRSV